MTFIPLIRFQWDSNGQAQIAFLRKYNAIISFPFSLCVHAREKLRASPRHCRGHPCIRELHATTRRYEYSFHSYVRLCFIASRQKVRGSNPRRDASYVSDSTRPCITAVLFRMFLLFFSPFPSFFYLILLLISLFVILIIII